MRFIIIACLLSLFLTLFIKPIQAEAPTSVVSHKTYLEVTPEIQYAIQTGVPILKRKIIEEFKDTPKMVPTINCESGFRQFDSNGKPLMSGTSDVGIMQINQVNWDQAEELGLDIFNSVDDNIAMGKIILKEQGIRAWVCSR